MCPAYNASPFAAPPAKLIPGIPSYLFGSWASDVAPTKMQVSNVALTSNVATLTVTVNEGNIPAVGSLITVQGTATASGAFNVTNVALTAVTINATSGQGTVTFALTHANVASTPDGGIALVPQPEVGDTLASGTNNSVPVGLPYSVIWDAGSGPQQVSCEVNFPTIPTGVVVTLQAADTNTPATQWQTVIANVVTVATGTATYGTTQYSGKWNFYRYSYSGLSGSGSIVAKLLI